METVTLGSNMECDFFLGWELLWFSRCGHLLYNFMFFLGDGNSMKRAIYFR